MDSLWAISRGKIYSTAYNKRIHLVSFSICVAALRHWLNRGAGSLLLPPNCLVKRHGHPTKEAASTEDVGAKNRDGFSVDCGSGNSVS